MRILMYSHDSYGLGHLRRTMALAEAFVGEDPGTDVLILTGSTISSSYLMSHGIDVLKLPSAVKVANGVYESSRMSVGFECLKELRSGLILSAAKAFDPHAFVVDKAPLGMKREVVPALEYLRSARPSTLTVLGLRDVMDDPGRVRRNWREGGITEAIEELYDLILVYGPREVYDPLPLYGLSAGALDRTHYVGYVGRVPGPAVAEDLPCRAGYVLVTAGGGGDGFHLIKNYLEGLRGTEPHFESVVVTGPLMDDGDRRRVEQLAAGLRRVRVLEFRPDMERLIGAAGAVVAMGGYNTTVELLAARKPTVIVPRVEPRVEQLIRAERLAELGLVEMIHPSDLTPEVLRRKTEELVGRGPVLSDGAGVDLSGARRAVEFARAGMYEKGGLLDRRQLPNKRVADRHVLNLGA